MWSAVRCGRSRPLTRRSGCAGWRRRVCSSFRGPPAGVVSLSRLVPGVPAGRASSPRTRHGRRPAPAGGGLVRVQRVAGDGGRALAENRGAARAAQLATELSQPLYNAGLCRHCNAGSPRWATRRSRLASPGGVIANQVSQFYAQFIFCQEILRERLRLAFDPQILDAKHQFPIPELHSKDRIENRLQQSLPGISSVFCACRIGAVLTSMPKFLSNGWVKVSCSVPS